MTPFVSILVPCFNEEKYIGELLNNMLKQDYPDGSYEILLIDGISTDGTRKIILDFIGSRQDIRLLDNPERFVPFALNVGILQAKGDIILRIDAHAVYPFNYVSRLVHALLELEADNVGASFTILPADTRLQSVAIACSQSSAFGIGNSEYLINSDRVRPVETVPFGCYRKSIFKKIGMFDEELLRNQDVEMNGRILKNGGRIFLVPGITIGYYSRDSLCKFLRMFVQYSYFRPLVNKKLKTAMQFRQFIPPVWVLFLLIAGTCSFFSETGRLLLAAVLGIYLACDLFFSVKSALGQKRWGLMLYLPGIFFLLHICYGCGYIFGVINFNILNRKPGRVSSTR